MRLGFDVKGDGQPTCRSRGELASLRGGSCAWQRPHGATGVRAEAAGQRAVAACARALRPPWPRPPPIWVHASTRRAIDPAPGETRGWRALISGEISNRTQNTPPPRRPARRAAAAVPPPSGSWVRGVVVHAGAEGEGGSSCRSGLRRAMGCALTQQDDRGGLHGRCGSPARCTLQRGAASAQKWPLNSLFEDVDFYLCAQAPVVRLFCVLTLSSWAGGMWESGVATMLTRSGRKESKVAPFCVQCVPVRICAQPVPVVRSSVLRFDVRLLRARGWDVGAAQMRQLIRSLLGPLKSCSTDDLCTPQGPPLSDLRVLPDVCVCAA
jgi:hypothetical protein